MFMSHPSQALGTRIGGARARLLLVCFLLETEWKLVKDSERERESTLEQREGRALKALIGGVGEAHHCCFRPVFAPQREPTKEERERAKRRK